MFLRNSSILPGAPLRPCWNVWQAKAFITILMQINCITHNWYFTVLYSHKGTIIPSEASPASSALAQCSSFLPCNPQHHKEDEEQKGAQGRALSWAHGQQNRQRSQMCSTKTAICGAITARHQWLFNLWSNFNEQHSSSILPAPAWLNTLPTSFQDEKSICRGAKKDPQQSELKDTGKSAPENPNPTCLYPIPSPGSAAHSQLSVLAGLCAALHVPWGREGRSEKSRRLAGRRCDKSLAEHKTKSNFKNSTKHLTAPVRASSALLCSSSRAGAGAGESCGNILFSRKNMGQTPKHDHRSRHHLAVWYTMVSLPAKKLYMVAHLKLSFMWPLRFYEIMPGDEETKPTK